ncbi:survival protein sure-like phosphatase/nucleotidase [Macrophomina phaseolina]|uniref:Survival protein sure-like phosphatase/nucleotidase n=1 Tax=Macrophomina phaseolina TaxID=35725 RepID=A0ABQ8G148_9PEZI|nr:survival protein sure-like phosphatase/nucleotidase [Macrophomina phaseolina]
MHILVTNDDGPPSNDSSPYVHPFIAALQQHGHTVSVVLPNVQRSWIGKAHIVGHSIRPTYFRPDPIPTPLPTSPDDGTPRYPNTGTTSAQPLPPTSTAEEWILVDSTPASCVQIGLHHYFTARGPVDLVVSGPNYGRNTTAVFALSSGTIGGAMEGAVCGKRSIALSFAFFDRNHDANIISEACEQAVKVIEHLAANWGEDAHLYSVNVPLQAGVSGRKTVWTEMLQNAWASGSCFQEVLVPESEDDGPAEAERELRKEEGRSERGGGDSAGGSGTVTPHARYDHKHFKWAPNFKDVHDSVEKSEPGNDGWAVRQGYTSVTPLRANFMHASANFKGELKI